MARKGRTGRIGKATTDPDRKEFLGDSVEGEKNKKPSAKGLKSNNFKGENCGTSNKGQ